MLFDLLYKKAPVKGSLFGVEVEIERDGGFDSADFDGVALFARLESDGSLRNGIEIVTAPLNTDQAHQFSEWYDTFVARTDINLSERCSTHIHVNVQDLTIDQFRSFLWLSIATEPVLMALCSPQRQNNTYCVPVYNSTNLSSWWGELIGLLSDKSFGTAATYLRNAPKYAAIGGFRLKDYGTLEFRMFDGLAQGAQLRTWILFLDALRDMAKMFTVEQLRDEKHTKGVLSILAPVIAQAAASVTNVSALLEKGIEMANDSVRKPMTLEDILAKHHELFPEEAPFVVNRSTFPRILLESTDLPQLLRKVDTEQLQQVYSTDLQQLYFDLCALGQQDDDTHVLSCIDLYLKVKSLLG